MNLSTTSSQSTYLQGFLNLLERAVSICENFVFGPVIYLMFIRANESPFNRLQIPLRVNPKLKFVIYILLAYFSSLIVWTIVSTVLDTLR